MPSDETALKHIQQLLYNLGDFTISRKCLVVVIGSLGIQHTGVYPTILLVNERAYQIRSHGKTYNNSNARKLVS